jgi:hypothetical protein
MESLETEILKELQHQSTGGERGVSLSYLIWKLAMNYSGPIDPQRRVEDLLMSLQGLQESKRVRFDDPIRGIDNMQHFTAYTHITSVE